MNGEKIPSTPPRVSLGEMLGQFTTRHEELSLGECAEPPALVLRVDGVLDSANSQDFFNAASLVLADSRAFGGLILDLASLSYLSSTGIGSMASLLVASRERETSLYLRGMRPQVKALFDALGFNTFFSFLEAEGGAA
jgi:anti-sigma B factor antagonist